MRDQLGLDVVGGVGEIPHGAGGVDAAGEKKVGRYGAPVEGRDRGELAQRDCVTLGRGARVLAVLVERQVDLLLQLAVQRPYPERVGACCQA